MRGACAGPGAGPEDVPVALGDIVAVLVFKKSALLCRFLIQATASDISEQEDQAGQELRCTIHGSVVGDVTRHGTHA